MLDDDGLPLDEVGPWARDKHERLRQYVAIAAGARATFIAAGGGASYVDLFCGSGRAVIRDSKERIDGSPLVAFRAARAGRVPFSEIHLGDIDPYGCAAAAARIANAGGAAMHYAGKAEDTVAPIVGRLDPRGLHFVYLDPFRLDDLPFSVLVTLAGLPHIDLLIHLNAQDLARLAQRRRSAAGAAGAAGVLHGALGNAAGIARAAAGAAHRGDGRDGGEPASLLAGADQRQRLRAGTVGADAQRCGPAGGVSGRQPLSSW